MTKIHLWSDLPWMREKLYSDCLILTKHWQLLPMYEEGMKILGEESHAHASIQSKTFIQSWCSGSMNSYNNTSIIVLYFCSKLPPIFFCINLFWNIPKNPVENSCVEAYRSLGEHQGFCYTSVQLPPIFFCIPFILKHSEKSCWELLHWS